MFVSLCRGASPKHFEEKIGVESRHLGRFHWVVPLYYEIEECRLRAAHVHM